MRHTLQRAKSKSAFRSVIIPHHFDSAIMTATVTSPAEVKAPKAMTVRYHQGSAASMTITTSAIEPNSNFAPKQEELAIAMREMRSLTDRKPENSTKVHDSAKRNANSDQPLKVPKPEPPETLTPIINTWKPCGHHT